jgi:hypothetical protein
MGPHQAAAVRALAAVALCSAAVASGCGVSSNGDSGTDPNDKRAAALQCLKDDKDVQARLLGKDSIQVDGSDNGPRIRFFLTPGEAAAQQFLGHGEGAEQINSALLFTREGSEDVLQSTEECLNDL